MKEEERIGLEIGPAGGKIAFGTVGGWSVGWVGALCKCSKADEIEK